MHVRRYQIVVIVISFITIAALGLTVSLAANRNSDRKFCSLVLGQWDEQRDRVEAYRQSPPTTASGQAQQAQSLKSAKTYADLYGSLGCPAEKK